MGVIRRKSGRWNYVRGGGADDYHKSTCNGYEFENMMGASSTL